MTASSLGAPHPAYVFPSKSFTELMFALFKETNPEVLCWIIVAIVLIGSGSSLVRAYYMREIQADFDYFHTLYASKMDSISMDGKSLDGIVEDICKKYKLV